MKIPFINTNHQIIEEESWERGEAILFEGAPLFVIDELGYPLGAVNRFSGLDPVGIIQVEDLGKKEIDSRKYQNWCVMDDDKIIGWIRDVDLHPLEVKGEESHSDFHLNLLDALPFEILVVDRQGSIQFMNDAFMKNHGMSNSEAFCGKPLSLLFDNSDLLEMLENPVGYGVIREENAHLIIQTRSKINDTLDGAIQMTTRSNSFFRSPQNNNNNMQVDIQAFYDSNWDVIYVSDGNGVTLDVSPACLDLWGMEVDDIVGKSVFELEKQGVYDPSVTRMVLETKQKVQALQTTQTGRSLTVIGTPIFNSEGHITRVINVSRDITEKSQLEQELSDIKMLLAGYLHELDQREEERGGERNFIANSESIRKIFLLAKKVAPVDATVMIYGESGVGKEVLANYIHQHSDRKDKPYIKINCSAIPPTLLESELFGYEKGSFTGADQKGKVGIFELAHKGTLFLDEIGEIPMELQVKLLRVLQEKSFMRLGGTQLIEVDVRVIAATNRNLEEGVRKGTFRKDLYYRLNVVPLLIPPLRDRKDDLLPLTMHFLKRFNAKHQQKKTVDQSLLEAFQEHSWDGNIRELQNLIERLVILTEKECITAKDLPSDFHHLSKKEGVVVNEIMPLREAQQMLEEQILQMAFEKYRTTEKIAEVLGVHQSTISRKLRK